MTHGSKCLLLEITFCYLLYLITSLLCDGNQIKQIYTLGHIFVVRKKKRVFVLGGGGKREFDLSSYP